MQHATGSGTTSAPLNRENIKEIVASPTIFISTTCFFLTNETRTRAWRAERRYFESRRHRSAFYDMISIGELPEVNSLIIGSTLYYIDCSI
jgi:hypothetical protein